MIFTFVRNEKNITITSPREIFLVKSLIREELDKILDEEWWAEAYDKTLADDPANKKDSVFVPKDVKNKIKKWSRAMKLDGR